VDRGARGREEKRREERWGARGVAGEWVWRRKDWRSRQRRGQGRGQRRGEGRELCSYAALAGSGSTHHGGNIFFLLLLFLLLLLLLLLLLWLLLLM
jgi:hypothetical protein